jgi:CheY-like chemotaxis protein
LFGGGLLSKKILVVEDSCDLRELLGSGLASLDWNPILAESGRESLAKLECETPSVILMDKGLGDMNGFELAAVLKRHPVYK